MRLIINADDFGLDIDRDLGILWGVIRGYITSVSVIITPQCSTIRKILIWIIRKKASVGIHINLTDKPLVRYDPSELFSIPYKMDRAKFCFWRNALTNTLNIEKCREEISIQLDQFEKNYRFKPTHIDAHNHCNIFNPLLNETFQNEARQRNIPLRIPYECAAWIPSAWKEYWGCDDLEAFYTRSVDFINMKDQQYSFLFSHDTELYNYLCVHNGFECGIPFIGSTYGYFRTKEYLIAQLELIPAEQSVQLMVHPGFYFPWIKHRTPFSNKDRLDELNALARFIKRKDCGIKLFNHTLTDISDAPNLLS